MRFKQKEVFVKVDEAGQIALENDRATMKYRLEDDREYHPWPDNLSECGAGGSTGPAPRKRVAPAKPARRAAPLAGDDVIVAYTDGACLGNPGLAGLGYVIRWPHNGAVTQRGEPLGRGTNNIAELTAILRVLDHIEDATRPIVIHTDSAYSIGVLTKNWKPKANIELIRKIRSALRRFERLELRKVKGHAGIDDNELVDQLARRAATEQREVSQP